MEDSEWSPHVLSPNQGFDLASSKAHKTRTRKAPVCSVLYRSSVCSIVICFEDFKAGNWAAGWFIILFDFITMIRNDFVILHSCQIRRCISPENKIDCLVRNDSINFNDKVEGRNSPNLLRQLVYFLVQVQVLDACLCPFGVLWFCPGALVCPVWIYDSPTCQFLVALAVFFLLLGVVFACAVQIPVSFCDSVGPVW